MVKRQKEKQYQSASEFKSNSQLRAGTTSSSTNAQQRVLPLDCCALTLVKIQDPVCTPNGVMFETTALLPFLRQHHTDPVTGTPMSSKDVILLHIDKNDHGEWQCPILTKVLSDHIKVVAVKERNGNGANVYSWEAYHELNVKTKNYCDLITGDKFDPKHDIILLNNPQDPDFQKLRDVNQFYHMKHGQELQSTTKESTSNNIQHSITAKRVMEKIQQQKSTTIKTKTTTTPTVTTSTHTPQLYTAEAVLGHSVTSILTSSSLTCTSSDSMGHNMPRTATLEEILHAQFRVMKHLKKKGLCTIHTNMGPIGIELHCDIVPRTCTNFLGLAERGKYNNSSFHRLIPTFMIQGGKGTTDDDDTSLWDHAFCDEFDDRLSHDSEGILSMANSGPGTNKRQFFITFQPTPHLNRKHTIFGRVIQGISVLQEMKQVPTDKKDRPIHSIIINSIEVLVNPAEEAATLEKVRIEGRMKELREKELTLLNNALGGNSSKIKTSVTTNDQDCPMVVPSKPAVGKYLNMNKKRRNDETIEGIPEISRLKPPPKKTTFGNFSEW